MNDIDIDNDPFALPPGFGEHDRQQAVEARRRSLVQWIPDAIERAAVVTLHVMMVLALIGFWGALLIGGISIAVAVIGSGA